MPRFLLLYVAPTVALLALAFWPLVSGQETLYTRDVLTGHFPMKAAQAEALRQGELPVIDRYRAGGQPLLGNPNGLPLYPDNLLYLVASPLWALNAHFWLHLLFVPVAGFWLGRAWGLGREAAWAVGVTYAGSGFFLSLMNLYNLVGGAALAPAFVAACLWGVDPERRHRPGSVVAAGVLWALLLLAGDPFFAALALMLAGGGMLCRHGLPERAAALHLVAAGILGTLLAAPMWVEFLRILPLSFRGYWQYSIQAALAQSWDPRSALEWLLPLFFGRPDFTFWGQGFYGDNPPLFYSLYPGVAALVLAAHAGRPRSLRSPAAWAWGAIAGGLFFALGAWNPAVRLLYLLPGAAILRYPVKFWLAVAIGAALLCGLGFERLLEGDRRRAGWLIALLGAFYAATFALFIRMPEAAANFLRGLDPQRLVGPLFERQRLDWAWQALLCLAFLALFALIVWLLRRRPDWNSAGLGAWLLGIHLAGQLLILQPLYDSDRIEHYTARPSILAQVPEDARVVHGGQGDLFGQLAGSPLELFPDPRFFWLARAHFAQLYPFSGIPWGRRYELNHSPEGLDTFFVISTARAIQRMSDLDRVRMLEASGVNVLLLDRELEPEARARVELLAHRPASLERPATGGDALDLYAYRLPRAAAQVQLVGTVRRAPHMNSALELLTAPSFDPRTMVVLPAAPETAGPIAAAVEGRGGRAGIVFETDEAIEVLVNSESGGVLVIQRAFLELYRATVDGRAATPEVANLHRLAVTVPPGDHRVRLWIDRRPTAAAWGLGVFGLIGLIWMGLGRRSRS